jgi:hypothetical protein
MDEIQIKIRQPFFDTSILTLLIVGIQIFFSSFLLSILGLRRRD